jgi:methionyl-tRNA formyltransferase
MPKKKVFILCATKNGLDLIGLIKKKYKIDCVITPKTIKNSTEERISAKLFCKENKIKFKEIKDYSNLDEIKEFLKKSKIDILISISWQRIIPKWLLELPNIACLGAHGSHQGMYLGKGRSPMNWSLLAGEKKFKFSLFKINKENIDSGPEIFKRTINISLTDDINSLYIKYHLILSEMILKFLNSNKKIVLEEYKGKQRFLPKITPDNGFVDWNRSDIEIYNFIRSKSLPYPNAYTFIRKKLIKIKSSQLVEINFKNKYKCGEIILILSDKKLLVKVKNGFLIIEIYHKDSRLIKVKEIMKSTNFKTQIKDIISRHYKTCPKQKINKTIFKLSK